MPADHAEQEFVLAAPRPAPGAPEAMPSAGAARRPARADRLRAARCDWIDADRRRRRPRLRLRRRRAHRDGLPGGPGAARRGARARASRSPTASRSCGRSTRSATTCRDRVYGPELMERTCARAARTGLRFYLYGGRNQGALAQLARNLRLRHPGLQIVGGHCAAVPAADRRRGGARSSPTRSTAPARTSSGSASACPSRRSGWRGCATGSTRPC